MELVEAVFYKKINPGDLLNIDLSLHSGGGGQTYLDLAGISESSLCRFLEYGSKIMRSNPPSGDLRQKFSINAIAIGTSQSKDIEFDPRNKRPNYKLSDQRGNRHPAWTQTFGFPHAPKNARYASDVTNIPYLLIYIIRTSFQKYYAGFVNSQIMPNTWPVGLGLERLFQGDRRGVYFFENVLIQFNNKADYPFSLLTTIADVDASVLPDNIADQSEDVIEYANIDISADLLNNDLQFCEFPVPTIIPTIDEKKTQSNRKGRHIDQARAQRNRMAIGFAGEQAVIEFETRRLTALGRPDLADQIEWISQTRGDGLGYDIRSFDIINGNVVERFIEVKTTTGAITKPFDISLNEVSFSDENPTSFILFRVFEFNFKSSDIRYYSITGSVNENFTLKPASYLALPKK